MKLPFWLFAPYENRGNLSDENKTACHSNLYDDCAFTYYRKYLKEI